jgi:hypothetical protein
MKKTLVLILVVILFVQLACNLPDVDGTVDTPSNTPVPRPTREPTDQEATQTPIALALSTEQTNDAVQTESVQATSAAQSMAETQAAMQSIQQATEAALAAASAPVIAELPTYGVDAAKGHLGWVHPDVTLKAEGYQSEEFANNYIQMIAKDFVMAADITWDSKYGDSGCGFVLRTDGNPDKPSQYTVLLSRIASGHAFFIAMAKGDPVNFRNYYANWLDPQFEWQNGTKNRLAVVLTGTRMRIYTNGVLLGEIDLTQPPPRLPDLPTPPTKPPSGATAAQKAAYEAALQVYNQLVNMIKRYHTGAVKAYSQGNAIFEQGLVGMLAYSYSGYMTCQFSNAWLWMIDQTP